MSSREEAAEGVGGRGKSGESYAECPVCGKKLNVKSMVRHKRDLHKETYKECSVCGRRLNVKSIAKHLRERHPDTETAR